MTKSKEEQQKILEEFKKGWDEQRRNKYTILGVTDPELSKELVNFIMKRFRNSYSRLNIFLKPLIEAGKLSQSLIWVIFKGVSKIAIKRACIKAVTRASILEKMKNHHLEHRHEMHAKGKDDILELIDKKLSRKNKMEYLAKEIKKLSGEDKNKIIDLLK